MPPDLFPASGRHLPGRQFPISLRVPLGGQLWVDRGKVIEARKDFPARTDRASAAQGRAAVNILLLRMAVFVFPPRMTSASRGDGFRRQRQILFCIPLKEQFRTVVYGAVFL